MKKKDKLFSFHLTLTVGTKEERNIYYGMNDVDTFPILPNRYQRPPNGVIVKLHGYEDCLCGSFVFNSSDFYAMDGFCNQFAGWGAEDSDAYARAIRAGLGISLEFNHTREQCKVDCAFGEFDDPISPSSVQERLSKPSYKRNLYIERANLKHNSPGLSVMTSDNVSKKPTNDDFILWLEIDTRPTWQKNPACIAPTSQLLVRC